MVKKNMSFFMKDVKICEKYVLIWDAIKNKLGVEFHSKPIWWSDENKFLSNGIPKENVYYTCIACINIDSIMEIGKRNYPQVDLEECNYRIKKIQMSIFISTELDSDLESDLGAETKSDTGLMAKLESILDSE